MNKIESRLKIKFGSPGQYVTWVKSSILLRVLSRGVKAYCTQLVLSKYVITVCMSSASVCYNFVSSERFVLCEGIILQP